MNAKRNFEATAATALTILTLFGSAPEAQAVDYQNPNQNPANRLARKYVKQIGGRVLNLVRQHKGDQNLSAIKTATLGNTVSMEVDIDTGQSQVDGSNGEYTFSAYAYDTGENGLGRSDIDSVRIAEGTNPNGNGGPLFGVRLGHPRPRTTGEGFPSTWYYAEGNAVLPSGEHVFFAGGTNPNRFAAPPSLWLNRSEIQATGTTMDMIIDAALNDQPTDLEKPPFKPLQPQG